MKPVGFLQINYQTSDHISTPALTQFFGVIDAAGALGYAINHSNQANRLMIDPAHLYDVAEALGHPIKYSPDDILTHLSKLTWPRYIGKNQFKTSIWPSGKRVTCWTFDLNKSETSVNQTAQNHRLQNESTIIELEKLIAAFGIWRDTISSVPTNTEIKLSAGELSNLLTQYHDQLSQLSKTLKT